MQAQIAALKSKGATDAEVNAVIANKDSDLYRLYTHVIEARDKHLDLVEQIESIRDARAKELIPELNKILADLKLPIRELSFTEPKALGSYADGTVHLNRSLLHEANPSVLASTVHHEALIHLRQDVDGVRAAMARAALKDPSIVNDPERFFNATQQKYETKTGKDLTEEWFHAVARSELGRTPISAEEMAHADRVAASGSYTDAEKAELQQGFEHRNWGRVIGSWGRRLEQDASGSVGAVQELIRTLNDTHNGPALRERLFGAAGAPAELQAALEQARAHGGILPAAQSESLREPLLKSMRANWAVHNEEALKLTQAYFNSAIEREAYATEHYYPPPGKAPERAAETPLREEVRQLGRSQEHAAEPAPASRPPAVKDAWPPTRRRQQDRRNK